MAPSVVSFLLLLFLLVCSCDRKVHGDDEGFGVLRLETLKQDPVCTISKVPSKNALRVVHRYGPCSPASDGKLDGRQILIQDSLRVAYLQSRIRLVKATVNTSMHELQQSLQGSVHLPARSGHAFGTGSYVVTIGIGTPSRNQTVEFDTGSNLCWVQCQPCRSCYPQQEPIFDPGTTHTYHNVTCNDPACTSLPPADRGCTDNTCVYRVRYVDSSSSTGFLAREKLVIGESNFGISNFVFGCGQANRMATTSSRIAGIFGLGRGVHSLATQATNRLGRVFSYCLPTSVTDTGYLIVGRSMAPSPSYTPMRTGPHGLYFVSLEGISVGQQRLPIPPSVFQGTGTLIDSGTTVSHLPAAAYGALRDAFRRGMSEYSLVAPIYGMDTCYSFGNTSSFQYPHIILHLSGADLPLTALQTFFVANLTTMCLAFITAQSGAPGVIGNVQQRGMEVIFDVGAQRIGFSRGTNCH